MKMKIYDSPEVYDGSSGKAVVIGKFDGFHLGHQHLLQKALESEYPVLVFMILLPEQNNRLLTLKKTVSYLEKRGVDSLVFYELHKENQETPPETFITKILLERFHMKAVFEGPDFCFGKNREGDTALLRKFGEKYGFQVFEIPKAETSSGIISSSLIREKLSAGEIEEANLLLGYPYGFSGKVVSGNRIGRTIGVPTANIPVPEGLFLPRPGVYKVQVRIRGQIYDGMANLGTRPTVDGAGKTGLEVHVFGFHEDIYDFTIEVLFRRFLRDEKKFSGLPELKEQLRQDMVSCLKEENDA